MRTVNPQKDTNHLLTLEKKENKGTVKTYICICCLFVCLFCCCCCFFFNVYITFTCKYSYIQHTKICVKAYIYRDMMCVYGKNTYRQKRAEGGYLDDFRTSLFALFDPIQNLRLQIAQREREGEIRIVKSVQKNNHLQSISKINLLLLWLHRHAPQLEPDPLHV